MQKLEEILFSNRFQAAQVEKNETTMEEAPQDIILLNAGTFFQLIIQMTGD